MGGRPSKPMAKNSNSKFTTRNNKQDIFSKMAQTSKQKVKLEKQDIDTSKSDADVAK
ncbi:MAG: hypothetical protein ACYDG2_13925 [Ruminiclostridium sp.]